MNIECPHWITCPGSDFPVTNFSSEDPDQEIYIGYRFPDLQNPPVLNGPWKAFACHVWCISNDSQEAADACAQKLQANCPCDSTVEDCGQIPPFGPDQPPPTNGVPGYDPGTPPIINGGPGGGEPTHYTNSRQTCDFECPDGTTNTGVIEAGTVSARSQELADQQAHSLACKKAADSALCVQGFEGFVCADKYADRPEYTYQMSIISQHPPVTWTLSSGFVPTGMTLEPSGLLHGHPLVAGEYNFTAVATDAIGTTTSRDMKFFVLGFGDDMVLPEGQCGKSYSHNMQLEGGGIYVDLVDGALPPGLTIDEYGGISGTATATGAYSFTLSITDGFTNSCTEDFIIRITGPCITCPPTGTICAAYAGSVTATPAGCTFAATMPDCLVLNPATGAISGIPYSTAPVKFTVTDPSTGQVNDKTCSFINPDGSGYATSWGDLSWYLFSHVDTPGGSYGITTLPSGPSCYVTVPTWVGACTSPTQNAQWRAKFKNCSGHNYKMKFTLSFLLNNTPCPSNPTIHPRGTVTLNFGGVIITQNVGAADGSGVYSGTVVAVSTISIGATSEFQFVLTVLGGSATLSASVTAEIDPSLPLCP